MSLTRAEIDAELARRGVQIPSLQEIDAELARRGVQIPESGQNVSGNLQSNILNLVKSGAEAGPDIGTGFKTGVENVSHGLMQPLLESGALGESIKRSSQNVGQQRQSDYEQASARSPYAALTGNILGGAGAMLPAAAFLPGGGTMGATAAFSKAPGFLKYLQSILGGAGSGAAIGASQYVNPEESRLGNAITGGVSGAGLGALGAVVPAVINSTSAIKSAFPVKKLAEGVINNAKEIENKYKVGYRNLFKDAKEAGVTLNVPKVKENPILNEMTKKESKYVRGFLQPGSNMYGNPKDANRAASDLGKMIRRLEKRREGMVGLNSSERKALEAAKNAQKKIRNSLSEGFEKSGRPDLAQTYHDLTKGFAQEVIPYRTTSLLNKYKKGELTDYDFIKSLSKNKKFKAQLGEFHPELQNRESISNAIKYGALGTLGAGTGYKLLNSGILGE